MKLMHGIFAGCLLVLPLGALAQDNTQGAGAPASAPTATAPAGSTQPAPQAPAAKPAEAAPAPAPATKPMPKPQTGFSKGSVAHEAFTTAIKNHEPANNLKSLSNDVHTVYFFTDLRDMSGQTATHQWKYNGKVMAEVHFKVRGARWRVWSSKNLEPGWTGKWTVSVLNGAGEVISTETLDYEPAAPKQPNAAPAAPKQPNAAPAMPMQKGNAGTQDGSAPAKDSMPSHDAMPSQDK